MDADIEILKASFFEGLTTRTREAYTIDLRQWFDWLSAAEVPVLEAKRRHVKAWKLELINVRGLASGTVGRKLSAVSSFYASAIDDEAIEVNPTSGVSRPSVSQESTRAGLDKREWLRLVVVAAAAGPAEHALVLLLGMNGLRVSEALAIKVRHLGQVQGRTVVSVLGKGAKPARPPLNASTEGAIRALIAERGLGPDDCVLPYPNRFAAKNRIVKLVAAAGITGKRITPHSLRHTFVTLALAEGVPLHLVQESARHADPRTTMRYNRARDVLENHATFALEGLLEGPPDA